jgi:hypothetical protein
VPSVGRPTVAGLRDIPWGGGDDDPLLDLEDALT